MKLDHEKSGVSRLGQSDISSGIIAVFFTANFDTEITEDLTHTAGKGKAERARSVRHLEKQLYQPQTEQNRQTTAHQIDPIVREPA